METNKDTKIINCTKLIDDTKVFHSNILNNDGQIQYAILLLFFGILLLIGFATIENKYISYVKANLENEIVSSGLSAINCDFARMGSIINKDLDFVPLIVPDSTAEGFIDIIEKNLADNNNVSGYTVNKVVIFNILKKNNNTICEETVFDISNDNIIQNKKCVIDESGKYVSPNKVPLISSCLYTEVSFIIMDLFGRKIPVKIEKCISLQKK